MSGPKRSGTTLLNRLFDGHPEIIDMNDEAYFWEHVYDYAALGCRDLFIDVFRSFPPANIREGFIDRDILPHLDGVYRQVTAGVAMEREIGLDSDVFLSGLAGLRECATVAQIWDCLVAAYAAAISSDRSSRKGVFIKAADYGKSILAARSEVASFSGLTIIRNPFYAIDSLKKYRSARGVKLLHPFNFGETIRDYCFWWSHVEALRTNGSLLICYEDLISDPERVMREVAAHVGISYVPELIRPSLFGEPWEGLSSFKKTEGIDRSALDRPLKMLSAEEIALIKRYLSPVLEFFGYCAEAQSPGKKRG